MVVDQDNKSCPISLSILSVGLTTSFLDNWWIFQGEVTFSSTSRILVGSRSTNLINSSVFHRRKKTLPKKNHIKFSLIDSCILYCTYKIVNFYITYLCIKKKNTNWLSVVITVIPLMCKHEKNNLFFEIISQHDTHILLLLDTLRLQEQQKACHNDSKSYV